MDGEIGDGLGGPVSSNQLGSYLSRDERESAYEGTKE